MSVVDRDLTVSACEAIGQGVDETILTRAIKIINQQSRGRSNFHDLWNKALLDLDVTDLFLQASYRRALSHYYRGRKAGKSKKTKPVASDVRWDRARVRLNDFVSIEFRAIKRVGTIKDKDLTEDFRVWHKDVRVQVSPEEYSKSTSSARVAINKLRRVMKKISSRKR